MDLAYRARVEHVEPRHRVAAEIRARHVHVVDVAQQPAPRPPRQHIQEIRLGDRRVMEAEIPGRILDQQAAPEPLLSTGHVPAQHVERLLGVR
jgi:hypothetical protein